MTLLTTLGNNLQVTEFLFPLDSGQVQIQGQPAAFNKLELQFGLDPKTVAINGFSAYFSVTHVGPAVYAVLYLDGLPAPSAQQIKEGKNSTGSLGIWAGSISSPSEAGTFDWPSIISGLSLNEGEALRYALVWSDGENDSDVSESPSFVPSGVTILDFDLESKTVQVQGTIAAFDRSILLNLEPRSLQVQGVAAGFDKSIALNLESKAVQVQGSAAEFYRSLQINLEPKAIQIQGTAAGFDKEIILNLESKVAQVQGFDATFDRISIFVLDQGQVRVQGVNTTDRKDYVLNLEPKAIDVDGFNTADARGYVLNLEPKAIQLQGNNTTDVRSVIFVLESKSLVIEGYDTDAGTDLVFPLDNKQSRIQGFDLDMQASKLLNLEPKQAQVQGFAAEIIAQKYLTLEPKAIQLQKFDATFQLDRVLPALAKQMLIQGFDASFTAQRFLNLESRQTRVQGFPATFIGAYVYPDPQFVKYGVTYGPSGTDFVGTFTFKPSFDLMTGNFVLPDSYRTFAFNRESNLTVLTADLVAQGVVFGISQTGTSKGYLSYDVNTARIARPVSDNALVVV